MVPFENPEKIYPASGKEVKEMKTEKQGVAEQKWQKAVDKAMNFLGTCLELDGLTGEINRESLLKKDLEKLQRLEKILGGNVIKYLGNKEVSSTIYATGKPKELVEEEERKWRKEDARIRSLSSGELIGEADKYMAKRRAEEEAEKETKK